MGCKYEFSNWKLIKVGLYRSTVFENFTHSDTYRLDNLFPEGTSPFVVDWVSYN